MPNIMKVTNLLDGKTYICKSLTSSGDMWAAIIKEVRRGVDLPLHRAIRADGQDSFEIEVLRADIPDSKIDAAVTKAIVRHNSDRVGYNAPLPASARPKEVQPVEKVRPSQTLGFERFIEAWRNSPADKSSRRTPYKRDRIHRLDQSIRKKRFFADLREKGIPRSTKPYVVTPARAAHLAKMRAIKAAMPPQPYVMTPARKAHIDRLAEASRAGVTHTAETRAKMSASHYARAAKLKAAGTPPKHSEETKRKIREGVLRRNAERNAQKVSKS